MIFSTLIVGSTMAFGARDLQALRRLQDALDTSSGSAQCASHSECADLAGNCCPTNDGTYLDCCNSSGPDMACGPDVFSVCPDQTTKASCERSEGCIGYPSGPACSECYWGKKYSSVGDGAGVPAGSGDADDAAPKGPKGDKPKGPKGPKGDKPKGPKGGKPKGPKGDKPKGRKGRKGDKPESDEEEDLPIVSVGSSEGRWDTASCYGHQSECVGLDIMSNCCPTVDNVYLDCCKIPGETGCAKYSTSSQCELERCTWTRTGSLPGYGTTGYCH